MIFFFLFDLSNFEKNYFFKIEFENRKYKELEKEIS